MPNPPTRHSSVAHELTRTFCACSARLICCLAATSIISALLMTPAAEAANATFTLTPTSNVWSTDTWSGTISTIAAGDIAQFNTAGTATTQLDTSVTLGQLQTGTTGGSIWNLTAGGGLLTLDGTGITSANQAFGFAGVAAIASRNALGNLTIAPNISFGTTALDIGATNTGTVTINGNISATAAQLLNFRGSGTGTLTVNGTIGNTGSAIAVNVFRSGGSTILNGTNSYTGTTTVTQGNLTFSGTGSSANSAVTVGTGGSTNVATLTVAPSVAGTTTRTGGLIWNVGRVGGGANNQNNFTVTNATGGNVIENFGALTLNGGLLRGSISANATGNTRVVFDSITRVEGTIFSFTRSTSSIGVNSIASQTANAANIVFNTAPTLVGNGGTGSNISILPYANLGVGGLVTYDATNGLRALATGERVNLASGLALGTGSMGQNANLVNVTLSTSTTVNALQGGNATVGFGSDSVVLTVSSGAIIANTNTTFGSGTVGTNGVIAFGAAEGIIMVENSRNVTVNSTINGSDGLTIVLDCTTVNTAFVVLNGANTFTGTTRFLGNRNEEMTVRLTNSLALQNTTLDYNSYGASLLFGNGGTTGQTAYTFGGLKGAENINLNNNNTTTGVVALTVGGNNESTVYGGVLSDTVDGGSLIKVGTGTLSLSGANNYTGGTTINGGALELANAAALNTSSGAIIFGGGTLRYGAGITTDYSSRIAAGTSAGAINIDTGANNVTFATALTASQSGGLVKAGTGTLSLTNNNAFTGGTILNEGGITSTNTNAFGTGSLTLNAASGQTVTMTLGNAWINLPNAVIVNGPGTNLMVGTWFITGQVNAVSGGVTLNNADFTYRQTGNGGLRMTTNGVTGTGSITFENNTTNNTNAGIDIRVSLNHVGTLTFGGTGDSTTNTTVISRINGSGGSIGSNVTGVVQDSLVNLDIAGATASDSTATFDIKQGTVLLNNTGALRVGNVVAVASGAVLDVRQSNTIAGLNNLAGGGGSIINSNTANTVLTAGGAGSYSFAGVLADGATNALAFTKSGTGTQTLAGASTYTGATTVSAGTLLVNNSTGSGTGGGSVSVSSGATLGGVGNLAPGTGNSIILNGSLAPGDPASNSGAGTLTFTPVDGNVTFGSTSTADFQLLTNGTHGYSVTYNPDGTLATLNGSYTSGGNDRLVFAGAASNNRLDFTNLAAGNFKVTFAAGYTPMANDLFDLLDWTNLTGTGTLNNEPSALTGLTPSQLNLQTLGGGLAWDTSHWLSDGVLGIYTTVPEPGRATLLMLGGIITLLRRKKRRTSLPPATLGA